MLNQNSLMQTKAMESLKMAALLLDPLVLRCSLSPSRECSPSFQFTSTPLPTTCRSVGNQPYTW